MLISYLLFAATGAFAGILAGMLGIGGGVIVVPCLAIAFTWLHFPDAYIMHMAAGTSLASMIVTSISSTYSHYQRGAIIQAVTIRMAPGVIIGTIVGSIIASYLSSRILAILFGIFLISVSVPMFLLLKPKATRRLPKALGLSSVGSVIGLKSGLLGVGGGAISVPYLTYCNIPMRKASGTSASFGIPISITGTIMFIINGWGMNHVPAWSTGYVYWPATIFVTIFSILFIPVGAFLQLKLPVNILKRIFSVLLFFTALNLLIG